MSKVEWQRRLNLGTFSGLKTSYHCIAEILLKILCQTLSSNKTRHQCPKLSLTQEELLWKKKGDGVPLFALSLLYLQQPWGVGGAALQCPWNLLSCLFPKQSAGKAWAPGSRKEHLTRTPEFQCPPCLPALLHGPYLSELHFIPCVRRAICFR